MPKVSIIIPTYNYAHYLPLALKSVFEQTYKDFEVIVVDDGSTDDTQKVVKKYLPTIKYLRHTNNKGFAAAMNVGIKASQGKYLIFLSADDKLMSECLKKEVAILEKHPEIGLVFSPVIQIDEEGNEIGKQRIKKSYIGNKDDYSLLITGNYINLTTALVRSEIVKKVGYFKHNLRQHPDWDMWLRVATKSRFAYLPEYLAEYRRHKQSLTAEVQRNFKRIGPEKKIVLEETIKDKVPGKLKPWMPLLFFDAKINTDKLPRPLTTPVAALAYAVSIVTSKGLRLIYD